LILKCKDSPVVNTCIGAVLISVSVGSQPAGEILQAAIYLHQAHISVELHCHSANTSVKVYSLV